MNNFHCNGWVLVIFACVITAGRACPYTCPGGRQMTFGNVCCPAQSRHNGYIPEQDRKPCDLFPKGYKTMFAYCKNRMESMCCDRWRHLTCPWTAQYRSWNFIAVPCPNTTASDKDWCLWDTFNKLFVTDC